MEFIKTTSAYTKEQQQVAFDYYCSRTDISMSDASRHSGLPMYSIRKLLEANNARRSVRETLDAQKASGKTKENRPRGERNHRWRGGKTIGNGYVIVQNPYHNPLSPPGTWDEAYYIRRHRLVWIQANGPIPDGMEIHHLNGEKHDDRLENLIMMSKKLHAKMHNGSTASSIGKDREREKIMLLQDQIKALNLTILYLTSGCY